MRGSMYLFSCRAQLYSLPPPCFVQNTTQQHFTLDNTLTSLTPPSRHTNTHTNIHKNYQHISASLYHLECSIVLVHGSRSANDYRTEIAGNRWFLLGAYFFASMNNVDFISEKWRTCRRTHNLAHIHVASSIFQII